MSSGQPIRQHHLGGGVIYLDHPHHRNGNRYKSQWIITPPEELAAFTHCLKDGWTRGSVGWGLHIVSGVADYLGIAVNRTNRLFIAKFVDSAGASQWHGYPVDHLSGGSDTPSDEVAAAWMSEGLVRPAKVRKILQGEPCKL